MKKSLLTTLFVFMALVAFCQDDAIYLKNGGVTRGTIIEQVPNQTVKIQTQDGSVFVYSFSEIQKIAKENFSQQRSNSVQKNAYKAVMTDAMKSHFRKGIAFTATGGVLLISGACSLAGLRRSAYTYDPYGYGYDSYTLNVGVVAAASTLMILTTPFLVMGPIHLVKYAKLKKQSDEKVSFAPSIKMHHTDGMETNASTAFTSFGAAIQFHF